MREILFRGKREYNGEWIEGKGIDLNFDAPHIITKEYNCNYGYFTGEYEVIPESVGQFVGLTDKNGKKIFEGDIVKHDFGEEQIGAQYAVVEYSDKYAAFMIKPLHDWMFCDKSDCEVIGTIHDNPELLEVEQ